MNEIVLSTLQADLTYFKNLQNFLDYISDCFSDSSIDGHFTITSLCLSALVENLEDLISDIQLGNTSFEYKK